MSTPKTMIARKMKMVKDRVVGQYPDAIRGLFVMGSATAEATPTSDLDLILVFEDDFFNAHFAELRTVLDGIAAVINAALPQHELAFWVSKADHHNTLLPDVSYLRANSPTALTRLDGWCGLAKRCLLGYVVASGTRIYGDFDFPLKPQRALPTEAPELFLIATRALAKGMSGRGAADPETRALAANDLAKAGLRAIAAVLLRKDGKIRLRYGEILDGSKKLLPDAYADFTSLLYEVKTGGSDEDIRIDELIGLFDYCERELAEVPRLKMSGLTHGSAGESFGFDPDALIGKASQDIGDYSRIVFADDNYYLFLYFTRTAYRIVEVFADAGIEDKTVLDFFLPELVIMAVIGFYNPFGMKLVLGQAEREDVDLQLGAPFIGRLMPLLTALAKAYIADDAKRFDRPWLPLERKQSLVRCSLEQLGAIPGVDVPAEILDALKERVSDEDFFRVLEWQSQVMKGIFSSQSIDALGQVGLLLYQAGEVETAQRVLEPVADLADRLDAFTGIYGSAGQEQLEQLREKLSTAVQYFALTFHQQGDVERARAEYLRALEVAPDNRSALADLCTLLLAHDPTQEYFKLLASLVEKAGNTESAREEVARQYQDRAMDLKQKGDFDEAKEWYQRTIDMYPTWAMARFNLGLLLEARGTIDAAVATYQKAIELDRGYVKPRNRLADLWREQGQVDKALTVLSEIMDLDIATADSFNSLGCCYMVAGELNEAASAFTQALELDPDHAIALSNLAEILANLGRKASDLDMLKDAARYLERSLMANPGDEFTRQRYLQVRSDIEMVTAAQSRIK